MTQRDVAPGRKSETLTTTNVGTDQKKAFLDALEAARQAVKPLVKKSLQAEDVPNDLLSFRMKQERE